jgi:hypothetical protein
LPASLKAGKSAPEWCREWRAAERHFHPFSAYALSGQDSRRLASISFLVLIHSAGMGLFIDFCSLLLRHNLSNDNKQNK